MEPQGGFILLMFKYLFIWLRQVLVVARGLLSSCDMWAPEDRGSVVEVCGLSTCGAQA